MEIDHGQPELQFLIFEVLKSRSVFVLLILCDFRSLIFQVYTRIGEDRYSPDPGRQRVYWTRMYLQRTKDIKE
jgi:hypothetical protein